MCGLLLADEGAKQKVQVVHTDHMDFPAGGLLRLKNSTGEVMVEGWDRPDVEITTVKSTKDALAAPDREKASKELDEVRISVQRQGEELVITTEIPRRRSLLKTFDLDYRIKVPMNARLAVDHGSGEVYVDNLASDMNVTVRNGEMTLLLPHEGQYTIDAKSRIGGVTSEFAGTEKRARWLLGHQFVEGTGAGHKLHLRVGYGDITIMKMQGPVAVGQAIGFRGLPSGLSTAPGLTDDTNRSSVPPSATACR
jgi:hypothetical protein